MATLLTAAAVLGLAEQCQHSFPPEMILAIARNESMVAPGQFDAAAVHVNRDGSRDLGLMQINTKNLEWLRLTEAALMDPCISIAAAEAVLKSLSAYNSGRPNGSPEYAMRAYLRVRDASSVSLPQATEAPARPDPSAHPDVAGGDVVYPQKGN
jgi:soluble lytic murein transglycosylase-like protein